MKWINFKDKEPVIGDFILAVRNVYPKYYWMGNWEIPTDETDQITHWMSLPEPPEE